MKLASERLIPWAYQGDPPDTRPTGDTTWADAKKHQMNTGNFSAINTLAFLLPNRYFRCALFWHNLWTPGSMKKDIKVWNLTWDGSVYKSIPYWEHQANPLIPIP